MNNYVITIARGFGSGGKEIGEKLSKRLGIPCYDSQLLKMASDESGINEVLFEKADEKVKMGSWVKRYLGKYPFNYVAEPSTREFTSDNNLFNIQSQIIRHLANSESCIIIGKCADYVLKDRDNVLSAYIEAPREACVKSIMDKLGVSEKEAHEMITKTDKYRADYYKYYSKGGYWTNPVNYDVTLNSDRLGRDHCVDILINMLKVKFDGTARTVVF